MPDPREDRTARALADLVAGHANLSTAEQEQLYRRLLAGHRGPVPPIDRSHASPHGQQGSEFQPLESRDFLRRVVSQAWNPTQGAPATGPAAPVKTPAVTTARVVIHDADSTITGIQSQITRILERHLNSLGKGSRWDGHLAKLGVQFKVSYATKEPSAAAKSSTLPLDYPLYFIDEKQDTSANTVARLHRIMDEHLIPEIIPATKTKIRDRVRTSWGVGLRGVSVPPGIGSATFFRKCAFFKGAQVAKEANGNAIFYVNAILHELGHMNNITGPETASHPRDGSVMNTRQSVATMSIEPLPYNAGHVDTIMSEVGRLWRAQQS